MSFEDFEEWLEENHPEHMGLMDEYTQHRNAQHRKDVDAWEEYLQEWGRFEDCPKCNFQIFYIQPKDFPGGASLFVPCLNDCGGLYITNTEGNITSQFVVSGEK